MTLDDLRDVTRAMRTFSSSGFCLLDPLAERMGEQEDARVREAISRLRAWNFRSAGPDGRGTFEAAIFGRWAGAFQRRVFGRPFGTLAKTELIRPNHNLTYRLLRAHRGGPPLLVDYLGHVKTAGEPVTLALLLRQSLLQSLADLEDQYGTPDMTAWRRPAAPAVPGILGEMPSSVRRGTYSVQVSLEPGSPKAESVLFPGNIESSESPHHADQFALYRDWQFKPMPFAEAGIERHASAKTILRVPDHSDE